MEQLNLNDDISTEDVLSLCSDLLKEFFKANTVAELITTAESTLERLTPLNYSGLYLYNENIGKLELLIAHGFSEKERIAAESTAMERHPGTVFKDGSQIYIPDTELDSENLTRDSPRSFTIKSRLYSPIEVGGKRIGVFGVVSSRKNAFSKTDIELFKFVCKLVGKVFVNIINKDKLIELNKEQKLLTFLATHTDNSVILADEKGHITWVNDAFINLTGFSLEEVIGKKPGPILQGERSDPAVINSIGNAIRNREKYSGVIINYTKQHEEYVTELSIYPFYKESGKFSNFISLQRNVTREVQYQEQIEHQKRRLDAMLSSLPDILFVVDIEGLIHESIINKDFHEEVNTIEYSGSSIYNFIAPENRRQLTHHLHSAFNNSGVLSEELGLVFNGRPIYVELRTVKMGERQALCLVRNIHEKFLMDQERLQVQRFNNALSEFSIKLSLAGAEEIDKDIDAFLLQIGRFFQAEHAFFVNIDVVDQVFESRSFSFNNKNWVVGKGSFDVQKEIVVQLIHELDPEQVLQTDAIVNHINTGATNDIIRALEFSNYTCLTLLPIYHEEQLIAFFGFTDIKTEAQVKQSQASQFKLAGKLVVSAVSKKNYILELSRYKAIFDNSYFGAVIINHRNEIVYQNAYVNQFFNSNNSATKLETAFELFSDVSNAEIDLNYYSLFNNRADIPQILRVNKANKEESHLLLRHLVLDIPNRANPLLAISFIDITDRINQENETLKAIEIVSEQNKKLLNFSYIVSHNIRSHVSNIMGFLSLADSEEDKETLQSYIQVLIKSSKSLDGTLKHLNELLDIQSRIGVTLVEINLLDLFEKTIQALSSDLNDIPNQIELSIPKDFAIKCDQAYADSIVLNLLSNAIKYRKLDCTLVIKVEAWKQFNKAYFKVIDNGKGVDLEKYGEKIFGMFKTFHGNRDARGIGLFITRNQIESLNGSIQLESSIGNGAAFLIDLPD